MQVITSNADTSRSLFARPLLVVVVLMEFAHLLVALLWPHAVLASNLFQLFFPLLAVAVSLHQRRFSQNLLGEHCWFSVAAAFGIWSAAQVLFIYFLYHPAYKWAGVRADDALWVLFGLPLLLAINMAHDEVDRVGWLDRAQAILFFVVLYLLVFLPSGPLSINTAYLIQNLALMLCCLLRLPSCTLARERRFFVRLTLFFVAYGSAEKAGDLLYAHGWQLGSAVDLVWTSPIAFFLVLVLRDALLSRQQVLEPSRIATAVNRMQGLSVAALAFLSIGMAALLATRRPLLGGAFLAGSFALFAVRTNARERAWHKAHGQLEETVLQDALTGLGNRTLLRKSLADRLAHSPGHGSAVLLFVDLDRFKMVNDSLGHALGDGLLIEVGARLRAAAPIGSITCRLGGDEFVVLTSAHDADEAQTLGEMLLQSSRRPFHIGGHILRCTASIGVVLATAGQGADDLLRTADHAMYRAKQLGKDRVQLFDATLLAEMSHRWQMEADLRDAVEEGKIEVAFQPILGIKAGEITGFEALARWYHPKHGQVSPADFIPLAEDAGLIVALGAQVLEIACRQVAAWNQAWHAHFSVSVNVSPRQFSEVGLLAQILAILNRTGLEPKLLRLEITESALLVHEETVKQVLAQARSHGIRIALDDFGTGYSSLSFLLNLPVDEVKVDRSFVSDMHSDLQRKELVRTVVQLGQSLGKRVVAEGVETEQDLADLTAMGCECAQGWLIGRPLLSGALEIDMPSVTARSTRLTGRPARNLPSPYPDPAEPRLWEVLPPLASPLV